MQLVDSAVRIAWSDGHESRLPFRDLRLSCPCAVCVDEVSGEPRLDPRSIPTDVRPLEFRAVGRYAVQFIWSDGHNSGIYTYDRLRALDPAAPVAAAESR